MYIYPRPIGAPQTSLLTPATMTTDRTHQHASAESNDSSDACITFGEYMQMLLSVTICYAGEWLSQSELRIQDHTHLFCAEAHPEVAVSDLCMYCMSDILLTGGESDMAPCENMFA